MVKQHQHEYEARQYRQRAAAFGAVFRPGGAKGIRGCIHCSNYYERRELFHLQRQRSFACSGTCFCCQDPVCSNDAVPSGGPVGRSKGNLCRIGRLSLLARGELPSSVRFLPGSCLGALPVRQPRCVFNSAMRSTQRCDPSCPIYEVWTFVAHNFLASSYLTTVCRRHQQTTSRSTRRHSSMASRPPPR